MKRTLFLGLLIAVNLALAGLLVLSLKERRAQSAAASTVGIGTPRTEPPIDLQSAAQDAPKNSRVPLPNTSVPSTPFTAVYSHDSKEFAANLRAIRCPEETVKDIITAEVGRRYRAQEDALRPKPADHVPWTWSARTSEGKLLQRRQQATALAREKAALLRDALGYDVSVAMPLYAMTTSDQHFEDGLSTVAAEKRGVVRQAHEDYWAKVQSLQARTKGFWESADLAELQQLKEERKQAIENILSGHE